MDGNQPAWEGMGKGPITAHSESCRELWKGPWQKIQEEKEEALNSNIQHWRFRNSSFQEAKGPRELCSPIYRLCWGWLQPEKHTKAQMLDRVILEQFVAILPREMQRWVQECQPETTCQATALAEGFLLSQMAEERQESCEGPASFLEVGINCPVESRDLVNSFQELSLRGISQEESQHQDTSLGNKMGSPLFTGSSFCIGGTERAAGPPSQGLSSFEEVTVYFTSEEWLLLNPSQNILRQEVLLETCRIVTSLAFDDPETGNYQDPRVKLPNIIRMETPEEIAKNKWERKRDEKKRYRWSEECNLDGVEKNQFLTQYVSKESSTGMRQESRDEIKGKSNVHNHCKTGKSFSNITLCKIIRAREKPYKCVDCGKSFRWSSKPKYHKRIHSGGKPYKCTDCGKTFSSNIYLSSHKRIHIGEKSYKCLDCGKRFRKSSVFKSHKRIHRVERLYKCLECGKYFSMNSSFTYHKRMHAREKPFECQECGKSFSQSGKLTSHKRIHTGKKPYKCLDCGKNFSRKANLISHKWIHVKEKPYECTDCGKTFNWPSSLVSHKLIHTGEKPYKCTECGKNFKKKNRLICHKWGKAL